MPAPRMETFSDGEVATFSRRLLGFCQSIASGRESHARVEAQRYRRFLEENDYGEDPLVGQSFVAVFLAAAQSKAMLSITSDFTAHQLCNIIKDVDKDESSKVCAPDTLRHKLRNPSKVKLFNRQLVDTSPNEFRFFATAKIPESFLHLRHAIITRGPSYPLGKWARNNSVLPADYGKACEPRTTADNASEASSLRKRRANGNYGEIQVHGQTIAYRTPQAKLLVDSLRLPLAYFSICCYEGLCNPGQVVDNQDA